MKAQEMKMNKETTGILNTEERWESVYRDNTKLYMKSTTEHNRKQSRTRHSNSK